MIYEHPVSIRDYKDYEVGGRFRFVNKKGKVAFYEVVGKYYKPKLNLYVIQTGTIEVKNERNFNDAVRKACRYSINFIEAAHGRMVGCNEAFFKFSESNLLSFENPRWNVF